MADEAERGRVAANDRARTETAKRAEAERERAEAERERVAANDRANRDGEAGRGGEGTSSDERQGPNRDGKASGGREGTIGGE
jgi:hypothetical protein